MRLIVCLILAAVLFQGTLAVTSRATQKKMMLEKINRSMEKSHLGRAMKNMVTLATKLSYSYDDLEEAFNKLSSSLLNRKENENNLYADQTLNHNTQVEIISANIAKYEGQVRDGEALVESLNEQLEAASNTLVSQQNELQAARDNLDAAQTEKANLIDAHDKEVADFRNAISFIREAVGSLAQAQEKFDNAGLGEFSFVQVKNTVSAYVSKIASATSSMRASHQLFIKPVIQAMNQLASSSSQSSIQTAINALNDLDAYFVRALAAADAIFENDLDSVNNRINSFEAQIALLHDTLIPQTEAEISSLSDQLEVAENDLSVARDNLAASQADLVNENEAFDNITRRHEALVNKISEEYSIVIQAQNIINDAKANLE